MAVAIPLALGAMGASAAVSIGVGLAVAATGIGGKIDKAASKVFGKDLVKVANIAGAAYMGYQAMGGAGMFGSTAAGAAGSTAATPAAFAAGDLTGGFEAAMGGAASPAAAGSAASTTAAFAKPVVSGTPGGVMKTLNDFATSTGSKINGLSDKQFGALAQIGGNALSGMAQGAAARKTAEEERRYKEEQDARFRSGSGLATYGPPMGPLAYARTYAPPYRG